MVWQYAFAAIYIVCAAGMGVSLFRLLNIKCVDSNSKLDAFSISIATAFGIAVISFELQLMAIAGHLKSAPLLALIILSVILFLISFGDVVARFKFRKINLTSSFRSLPLNERLGCLFLLFAMVPTIFAPLSPPLAWDELMYHLPHAKEWARSGELSINPSIRYPRFPFGFDVLFTVALIFENDVFAHFIHAISGWIVGWMIYEFIFSVANRFEACLCAGGWLYLSRGEFQQSYVDMGITMWEVACAASVWKAFAKKNETRIQWLLISAFCLGAGIGGKYQALTVLPLFVFFVLYIERRPIVLFGIFLAVMMPCAYWYFRNYLEAGDPFSPIGGELFGFTDWNHIDFKNQILDIKRHSDWPPVIFTGAIFAFMRKNVTENKYLHGILMIGVYEFLIWILSSRYPRYLMPAYPFILIASVRGFLILIDFIFVKGEGFIKALLNLSIAIFLLFCIHSLSRVIYYWKRITPTPIERNAFLNAKIEGFAIFDYLKLHDVGRLYQFGSEDCIYYFPVPVWGDVFGPWRYRDYTELDANALRDRLVHERFDTILINLEAFPDLNRKKRFEDYFELIYAAGRFALYKVIIQ